MTKMSLIEYLQETKKILNSGFQEVDTVHVVIGNESCDLDSAVSAIALAYLFKLTSSVAVIPVLNIPKQKYRLRTETTYLFRNRGILDDLLTFSDQIDLHELKRQGKLQISLVDHNVLPGRYSDLDDCVISVTDHRPQVREPDNRVKIKIEPVGSCSTLITEEILNTPDLTIDSTVYTLLYGTILIDTVNLSPAAEKMTEKDVKMVDKLKELLPDVNGDDLYGNIQKAKIDTSDLTTLELLEKDLKIVSGKTTRIAMSSVNMKLQDFLGKDNLQPDLSTFSQSQSVNGVVVMMIHEVLPGQPARDILIYSTVSELLQKLCDNLTNENNPDLILESVSTNVNNTRVYHQGCIKASRKLVLPIIQRTIDEFTANQSNNSNINSAGQLDNCSHSNQTGTSNSVLKEGTSNETKNIDLLSGTEPLINFDPVPTGTSIPVEGIPGTSVGLLEPEHHRTLKNIPEISINNSLNEFDEADVMFQSLDITNSSQCSSGHTSGPPSAFTSYPVTPPNSFTDTSGHFPYKDFTLPSLNSAEMLEKIKEKKGRLPSCEHTDEQEGNSVPYTPQNSYMEGAFEQYAKDHQLPSFNSAEMVQRIEQKRSSMEMSNFQQDVELKGGNEEFTPFTPHNSYMDISFLEKNNRMFLDTNKLQQTLENIEVSMDTGNDLRVKERTDSGLLIFDTSDMFNPTDVDMNIVAVGVAQEMIERETTEDDILISFDNDPSDGGNGMNHSETFDASDKSSDNKMKESDSSKNSVSQTDRKSDNVMETDVKYDNKTESLLLRQSIDEFAQNLTGKLIDEAINAFPEKEQEIDYTEEKIPYRSNNTGLEDMSCTEIVLNSSPEEPLGKINHLPTTDSGDLPVETDYLSSVDPFRGNLHLAEENQEIVESTSFRKISGEEPQTVRQEILRYHTQDKVEEEPYEGGVNRYAASLVQQVISGAIATVTMTTSTSDVLSDESGVTWSREESFDTVSLVPQLESGRSSFDKNSRLTSFDSDDVILDKNCQIFSSIETQGSINSSQSTDTSSDSKQQVKVGLENLKEMEQKQTNSREVAVKGKSSIHSIGSLNLTQMESLDYISSENESDNLSPLKLESANLLSWATSDSVPYNVVNKASLDSSVKPENSIQQQSYKPTYQRGDTVDYISSEGEGQNHFTGMDSSLSSEPTSTTTEGSYQIMSPDQQLGEIITTSEGQVISPDQTFQFPAKTGEISHKNGEEMKLLITRGNNSISEREVTVTYENEKETRESTCDLEKIENNESEASVFDDKEIESDAKNRKEIYMTSAGRISIASDGGDTTIKPPIIDRLIEESVGEVGKLIAEVDNTLTQADEAVSEADTILASLHTGDGTIIKTRGDQVGHSFGDGTIIKTRGDQDEVVETKDSKQTGEGEGDQDNKRPVDNGKPVDKPENKTPVEPANVDINEDQPKGAEKVKRGMDFTDEWHEDPIPGMENRDTDSSESDSDTDSDGSDRPANRPTSLQTHKKKKISANFNILKEDYTSPDEIDTVDNGGDLEWENDTPVSIPKEPIPEYTAEDEYQDAKHWRGVEVNGKQQKIDLKVIDPYKKVLSHGGYYGDGLNAIIVFSGCYLPDRNRKDYQYVMDNLFLYVISTLELLVAEDYMIVYFHGATPRRQMPSFGWLKKCYQLIDRRLRKNLKGLLLIHPTLWLRTIVLMTKPFISSKFSSKLRFVRTLHDLSKIVPMEYIYVPDQVQKYDSNLLQPLHSPTSSSAPHTPP